MNGREGHIKILSGKILHNLYIFGLYGLVMLMFTILSPDFLEVYSLGAGRAAAWRRSTSGHCYPS